MDPTYSPWLVFISIVVASLASYTALDLASRISASRGAAARTWLVGGAISMGTGIWSMHFIGMLALRLPIVLGYEWGATVASLLFAIASSFFALFIVSGAGLTWARLAVSGTVMGLGIAAMHYVGMGALDMTPPITYDSGLVAASIAIAIGASTAALWAAYRLRGDTRWSRYARVGSALIMGLAIYGMHYTAMAAANFAPGSVCHSSAIVDTPLLAGSVTAFTLFLLCTTLFLSLIDARMEARTVELASAQEANRAKDQFLAMLGHELRNPLAAISNAIQLLDQGKPGDQTFTFAHSVIARQTAHLTRLIDDLLDVSRVMSGKVVLNLEPLDLNESVQHALAALRAAGRSGNHDIRRGGSQARILGDRTRVEQIITNLLVNAVNYTPRGGCIEIHAEQKGHDAVLVVSDTGIGIAPAALPHVFDLFFQSGQETYRSTGGLGIGLTLVRRLAEMHHGTVKMQSDGLGKGARVTVRFPVIPPRLQPAAAAPAPRQQQAGRDIAIVEDEPDALETLRMLLEAAGHRVATAADGASGLKKIRETRPDIAIVDISLPGLSGYEIARRLRAQDVRTYLIALSGYGSEEDRQRALSAGFDAHLAKPADLEELNSLIADAPARR